MSIMGLHNDSKDSVRRGDAITYTNGGILKIRGIPKHSKDEPLRDMNGNLIRAPYNMKAGDTMAIPIEAVLGWPYKWK